MPRSNGRMGCSLRKRRCSSIAFRFFPGRSRSRPRKPLPATRRSPSRLRSMSIPISRPHRKTISSIGPTFSICSMGWSITVWCSGWSRTTTNPAFGSSRRSGNSPRPNWPNGKIPSALPCATPPGSTRKRRAPGWRMAFQSWNRTGSTVSIATTRICGQHSTIWQTPIRPPEAPLRPRWSGISTSAGIAWTESARCNVR